jgi:hypothetical protein
MERWERTEGGYSGCWMAFWRMEMGKWRAPMSPRGGSVPGCVCCCPCYAVMSVYYCIASERVLCELRSEEWRLGVDVKTVRDGVRCRHARIVYSSMDGCWCWLEQQITGYGKDSMDGIPCISWRI